MSKRSNYDKQMRKVDLIYDTKRFKKFEDKLMRKGQGNAVWKHFEQQQQQTLGFQNYGGGITIPAAQTWQSQAWNNTTTYVGSGTGIPNANTFVQVNGVVYAAPTTNPAGAPPGSTWVIQPQSPGGNAWQVNPVSKAFSNFAGPGTGMFPAPPTATDVVDSAWYIPDTQVCSTTASQWYIPAPGIGFLIGTTAANPPSLQYNLNGTWTTAVLFAASTAFYTPIMFDGLTWRMLGAGTTLNTYTIYRSRQTVQT